MGSSNRLRAIRHRLFCGLATWLSVAVRYRLFRISARRVSIQHSVLRVRLVSVH